jgi:hypothetical protein
VQGLPGTAFSPSPRDNIEQSINLATSAPTQDTYPYTNTAGAGSRSGSNDPRGLGRPTTYIRHHGGEEVEYRVGRGSISSQPSSESPRAGYATLNKPSTTHLSRLSFEFAQLPYADYASCEEFVAKNPTILQDDPNSFLQEALQLEKEGRSSQARVNVQRSILLRQCRKTSHNGRQDFFSGLKRKDPNILGAFVDDFDKTMKAVRRAAQTETENNNAPDIKTHGPDRPYRGSADTTLSSGMQTMNLGYQNRQGLTNAPGAGLERQNPATQYGVSQPGPVPRRFSLIPAEEDSEASAVGAPSIEPEIRGTEKESEDLDPRYVKRSDARKFFVVGRVFALLWHENAGEGQTGREGYIDHTTEGRFGSRVFSHIRRMAVVIERKGYCVCIPIHTYGGQGILKRGLDLKERQAHSIIHASDTNPAAQKEERAVLVKKPIAVTMANKEQKLDKSSRINFAKPHTVEWNVKVMNVGRVTPESLPAFKSYFRKETGE